MFRVGDVRVVDVNSVLCPVEPAAGGAGVRWSELAAEIDALAAAGSPLVDAPAPLPPELPPDWLAREQAAQSGASIHGAGDGDHDSDSDDAARARTAEWARLYAIAGDELARREAAVARRVALLAASLRYNAIFRKDAPPYPETARLLPARLRALVFLGALASRTLGTFASSSATDASVSLRGLTELWQQQAGAIDVLARWDDPVPGGGAPTFDADVPPLLHGALGRVLAGAFRGSRTVGALVGDAAAALPPEQRALAIALVAARLPTLLR